MRSIVRLSLALGLGLLAARTAQADYWDASVLNDDSSLLTGNEMSHGVSQQHDLQAHAGPVADQDWSLVELTPYSSYEAIVDSVSRDLLPFSFTRMASDGTTQLQSGEFVNTSVAGVNVAMRWSWASDLFDTNFLRVGDAGCTTSCTGAAQYHIRFHETTISVPRFNNANGQVTVLIVQNSTSWTRDINGIVYFWSSSGLLMGSSPFNLAARAALVLNTSNVASGLSGTITIIHDGGYGGLTAKSVALEPATGFSFDSPGLYKPQ